MGAQAIEEQRRRVLALLERHGWNATSFQVLEPGFHYWFSGPDACVAYIDTGRAWVAAGAPIAAPEDFHKVVEGFAAAARRSGRGRVCYFATEERFVRNTALTHVRIGEQPVWDPQAWDSILRARASLREQIRRARAKGVSVRRLTHEQLTAEDSPERRAIDHLIKRWQRARPMAPMGFLVQIHPFVFPDEHRYFIAQWQQHTVGFLAAIPVYARNGWFLEDLLRDPVAPNGTAELLVDSAMRAAAEEGRTYLTLGLAPLSGSVSGWLRAIRPWAAGLYNFDGLRAFKEKLSPRAWDPIFLSHASSQSSMFTLYDTLYAFARGGLLRFGIETLLRGPLIVVRLLALLLFPWTILLALADTHHWFPSRAVQAAWVGFDVLLALALLALSLRWRERLSLFLAPVVTLDALLTLFQACAFNAKRAQGLWEWIVVVVSVLAPSGASLLLWRARAHRSGAL